MMDLLWQGLLGPFVEFGFMKRAWAGSLVLSLSAAPLGVFLMLRRMSLMGDAVAHGILPGAALGYLYAGLSLGWMTLGGIAAGMVVAVVSGLVARSTVLKEDASLAAFYLLSLAVGVLIVSTRGNNVDLLHVLFGTVLSLDNDALLLLGALSSTTLLGLALLYRPLVLECLDPAFLRQVSRWSPVAHYGFLGLLVLPAASARFWVQKVGAMLALAAGFALLGCTAGLLLSFHADWPSGPTIVLCLGGIYLLSLVLGRQGLYPSRPHSHLRA